MSSDPIETFGLTCPNGGDFYVCQDSDIQFLGCCASDPCADGSGSCSQDDLRYSSFDADKYQSISAQACSGDGAWYTCASLDTPYLGCCSSNACSNETGCSHKHMVPAVLSSIKQDAAIFETTSATSGSSGLSKGAIAGISIACVLFVIASVVALFFFARRRRHQGNGKEKEEGDVVEVSELPSPGFMANDPANSSLSHDPNRPPYTPSPINSPAMTHQMPALAAENKSPPRSSWGANSVMSWLSKPSQKSSMSSINNNKSPPPSSWQGSPTRPRHDVEQQQQQQQLGTVAELEGMGFSSSPPSELPAYTPSAERAWI